LNLEPGAELGYRYRIDSLIGQGGMGAVYKAHDLELDRSVALKVIRPELANQPEAMQRFKQELLLASRISHKNILRIHDLVEVEGTRFISMAYVDGEDLYALLNREGRLPLERFMSIARQLCSALEAAHSEGIIHRDLKPQNVMIDRAGDAFISDFGMAKSLEAGAAKLTHTGELLGTPRYMSPEQVEGKQADRRSDLYALGLIFYEMVTGEVPFTSDSVYQTLILRTKEAPKNPKLLNPDLPDFLVRIILRCLESDPDRRYESARDILHDLEAEKAPARAVKISLIRPSLQSWIARAGLLMILASIALLLPALHTRLTSTPAETEAEAGAIAHQEDRRYIAVLPLESTGEAVNLEHIVRGLGETLSARLAQLQEVSIPPYSEVEKASVGDSLEKTARSLGVKLIVHGTVAGTGEQIRATLNVEDIDGGRRLWSKEFTGFTQDLLTLEDQIYSELLGALRIDPDNEARARAVAYSTENIDAYDLYLKGRNAMRGQQEAANLTIAIDYFEKALKSDARFALAYVGLADASMAMYRETKDSLWSQKALAAGE
jgi:serine/threonine protein kinase